jgi:hypothetical protein
MALFVFRNAIQKLRLTDTVSATISTTNSAAIGVRHRNSQSIQEQYGYGCGK